MSLIDIAAELEYVPQDQLVQFMSDPNSRYPEYLVLSEIQRRTQMKQMYENQMARQNQPSTTVAEEAVMELSQGAMPSSAEVSSPLDAGITSMAPPSPQMGMASGGLTAFANGGLSSVLGGNVGTLEEFRRSMIEEYMAANPGATTQEAIDYANQNAESIYNERLREPQSIQQLYLQERQPLNLQSFDPDQIASNVLAGAEASAERRKELALDGFMGDRLRREGIDTSDLSLGEVVSEYDRLYREDNPVQGFFMDLRDSPFGQEAQDFILGEDRKFGMDDLALLALGGGSLKAAARYGPKIFNRIRSGLGTGSATTTVPAVVSRTGTGTGTAMVPYVGRGGTSMVPYVGGPVGGLPGIISRGSRGAPPGRIPLPSNLPVTVPPVASSPSMFSRFATPISNFFKNNRILGYGGLAALALGPLYNYFTSEDEPEPFDMSDLYTNIDFEALMKNRQTKTGPSGAERVAALNLPKVEIEPFTEEDKQRELDVYALGSLAKAFGSAKNLGEAGAAIGDAAMGLPAIKESQRKRSLEAASAERAQAIEEFGLANELDKIDIARVQAENTGNRVLAGELASVRAEIAAILKDSGGFPSGAQQARLSQLLEESEILKMDLYGKLGMEYVPPGGNLITN